MPRKRTTKKIVAGPSSIRLGTCLLRLNAPRVMGVVNNTPDSFSGDGTGGNAADAIERGLLLLKQGADIVDVGGESTRPGAIPVPQDEEMRRVVPVIEKLSEARAGRISVDSTKPEVVKAALFAGASIVNDVSGLRNPEMIEVVAEHDAAVIIMHMLGEPRTMQVRPRYKDVVGDIKEYLRGRIDAAESFGISPAKIMVDPGIGFGKTLDHNLEILARLREFRELGKPLVIGVSRKSFIGKLTGMPAGERLEGSLSAAVLAVSEGANIVRTHDVAETVRALQVAQAVISRRLPQRR